MRNPPHPGGFVLRQCIAPLGLTITAAALGVTRTTLSELVNGKRGISPQNGRQAVQGPRRQRRKRLVQQAQYDLAQVRTERIKLKRLEFA
jgi:addiction module HigA family antidote